MEQEQRMVPQVVPHPRSQLLQRVETEDYMEALEMEERAEVERVEELEELELLAVEEEEIVRLVQTTAVTMVVTEAQGQTVMAAGAEVRAIRVVAAEGEAQAGVEQLEVETVPCLMTASLVQQIQEAAEGEAHPTFLVVRHTMAATEDLVLLSFLLLKAIESPPRAVCTQREEEMIIGLSIQVGHGRLQSFLNRSKEHFS